MSIQRRHLIAGGMALLTPPDTLFSQATGKVWRIGVLLHNVSWEGLRTTLRKALGEFGYEEGRNLVFEPRSTGGLEDRLTGLAAELVAARVDLIVAPLNPEILAAKRATSTIPVVMMYSSAPVETGLITSLARPGGNLTGTTTNAPNLAGKMVEVLRDAVPRLTRMTILNEPDYPGMALYQRASEGAANAMGIKLVVLPAPTLEDLENSFKALERDRPDAILVAITGAILANITRVIEFAARQRIPALYSIKPPVAMGGLMSYSANFRVMAQRNAWMIDKIFKGARPADIPVEEPAQFELAINLRTAKTLGLTIPQSLLLRADEVIQ